MSFKSFIASRRSICRISVAVVFFAVSPLSRALSQANLKWDLTYRSALAAFPLADDEFLPGWIKAHPDRPIYQKLAEYSGEPIEASLLIEEPAGGADSGSMAKWLIKTKSSASLCTYFQSSKNSQGCQSLDPVRAEAVIRKVMGMKPLLIKEGGAVNHLADGKKTVKNYEGFLSIYWNGVSLQRPIHRLENHPDAVSSLDVSDEEAMQLARAMMDLSPPASRKELEYFEYSFSEARRAVRVQRAVRDGDEARVLAALNQESRPSEHRSGLSAPELLPVAAKYGQFRMVDVMLARGADINRDDGVALRTAIEAGNRNMVEYLLGKGALPDPKSAYGLPPFQSPLGAALQKRNATLARLLIERGAKVNESQSTPLLTVAVQNADLSLLDLLLQAGADPNATDRHRDRTPLIELAAASVPASDRIQGAREQARLEWETTLASVARRLVAAGADVNFVTGECETAFTTAKSEEMKRLLVTMGADPHLQCLNTATMKTSDAEAQSRGATTFETKRYLDAGDYRKLEELYQKLRDGQQRTPSGIWKLAVFYNALKDRAGSNDAHRQVDAWLQTHPASVGARIFQAYVYQSRPAQCGCDRPYAQLSPAQRDQLAAGSARALKVLADAKAMALKSKDPEWYRAMLATLPYSPGFTREAQASIMREGMAKYPGYHEIYFTAALHSLPPWSTSADDVDKVAQAAASDSADAEAGALYARVYWYMDEVEYRGRLFKQSRADWPTMRKSFDVMVKRYPDALNLNAYAYFACLAKDYKTARDMMQRADYQFVRDAWGRLTRTEVIGCLNRRGS
jgi:hypothetical protein